MGAGLTGANSAITNGQTEEVGANQNTAFRGKAINFQTPELIQRGNTMLTRRDYIEWSNQDRSIKENKPTAEELAQQMAQFQGRIKELPPMSFSKVEYKSQKAKAADYRASKRS